MNAIPSLLAVLSLATAADAPADDSLPSVRVVSIRRVFHNGEHNAFTDLVRQRDNWFCVFREGSGHIPGTNGAIRVLRSPDGQRWDSAALVAEHGIDLRDPKISVMPDGCLMLLMGGSVYAGEEGPGNRAYVSARTRVAFSTDGRQWSPPQPVSVTGEWLWRVTWHKGLGYGIGDTFYVPAKDVLAGRVGLGRGLRDGRHKQQVSVSLPPGPGRAHDFLGADGPTVRLGHICQDIMSKRQRCGRLAE